MARSRFPTGLMFGARPPTSQAWKIRPPIRCRSGRNGVDRGEIAMEVASNVVFEWPIGASGVTFSLVDAPGEMGRTE